MRGLTPRESIGLVIGVVGALVDIGVRIHKARRRTDAEERLDALEEKVQALESVAHTHEKPRRRK